MFNLPPPRHISTLPESDETVRVVSRYDEFVAPNYLASSTRVQGSGLRAKSPRGQPMTLPRRKNINNIKDFPKLRRNSDHHRRRGR